MPWLQLQPASGDKAHDGFSETQAWVAVPSLPLRGGEIFRGKVLSDRASVF